MKIAIVHNYFDVVGGGEWLVVEMARMLHADIITTDVRSEVVNILNAEDLHFVSLGKTLKMPGLKQISASFLFAHADLRKNYDFFILSGEWAMFAARKHQPNLYYCHTPVRVFYDLYDSFVQRQSRVKKPIFKVWVMIHKFFLERQLKCVQKIVCNSKTTQARIKKFLKRDADVVYPFSRFALTKRVTYGDFWLSVNRFYPEKRIELQLEALRILPNEKLVIVGGIAQGDHAEQYDRKIKRAMPKNVVVLSNVSEEKLAYLYQRCKGLLATARDEDFGMNIIEAFSFGKPVVAVKEGGYRETMIQGKTGFLVDPNPAEIVKAMERVGEKPKGYARACRKRAKKFGKAYFFQRLTKYFWQENW